MYTVTALAFMFTSFIFCDAAFVDTLKPCSITDEECLQGLYHHIMKNFGHTGIEELELPPLTPFKIKNTSVTIVGVTLTITEGTVKGMDKCVFNKFNIDLEKHRGFTNVTCDALTLKGQFIISGENSEWQSIIGSNTLNGQGRAKIKLEKINVNIEYSIYATKKDGDIYLQISEKNNKYTYDIGNAHFVTEKVIIANNDFSELISSYLNANWRETIKQYGSIFMDKALELLFDIVANMCNKIPANKYITEDLSSYLED